MTGKLKKGVALMSLLLIVIGGIYIVINIDKDDIDANYKPMVKVNDRIYYWTKDLEDIDLTEFIMIGRVENSDNSISKSLDKEDKNFSSNVYPIGSRLYIYDETSIMVETNSGISLCVEGE